MDGGVAKRMIGMIRSRRSVENGWLLLGRLTWRQRLLGLSWTYKMPRGMIPPSIFFDVPLCGEIMGAGFQRLPESSVSCIVKYLDAS